MHRLKPNPHVLADQLTSLLDDCESSLSNLTRLNSLPVTMSMEGARVPKRMEESLS